MSIIKKSNIMPWSRDQIDLSPTTPGVYVLRNIPSLNGIIYIRSSGNIKNSLSEHWLSGDMQEVKWFDWYETDSINYARTLEATWIDKYAPKFNHKI